MDASESTPTQRAALAVLALLLDGPQRERDLSRKLYVSQTDAWRLLNTLGDLPEFPVRNDGGWWHVDGDLNVIKAALRLVEDEDPPGVAYARPLHVRDKALIRRALRTVLRICELPQTVTVTVREGVE